MGNEVCAVRETPERVLLKSDFDAETLFRERCECDAWVSELIAEEILNERIDVLSTLSDDGTDVVRRHWHIEHVLARKWNGFHDVGTWNCWLDERSLRNQHRRRIHFLVNIGGTPHVSPNWIVLQIHEVVGVLVQSKFSRDEDIWNLPIDRTDHESVLLHDWANNFLGEMRNKLPIACLVCVEDTWETLRTTSNLRRRIRQNSAVEVLLQQISEIFQHVFVLVLEQEKLGLQIHFTSDLPINFRHHLVVFVGELWLEHACARCLGRVLESEMSSHLCEFLRKFFVCVKFFVVYASF